LKYYEQYWNFGVEDGLDDVIQIGSTDNFLKRIDNEYELYRFDSVETLNRYQYNNQEDYSSDDIRKNILTKLDYDIEFAEDRLKLVNDLLDQNDWIYDFLSSPKIIVKELKKKSSFLAEKQRVDHYLELIATYLCFPMFKNQKDKDEYEILMNEYQELRRKNSKNEYDYKQMVVLKNKIDAFKMRLVEENEVIDNKNPSLDELEKDGIDIQKLSEEEKQNIRNSYKSPNKNFDVTFWGKMGYSDEQKDFRNELINNFESDIQYLKNYLGYDIPNKEQRDKFQDNLIQSFKPVYIENGKVINPRRQFKIIDSMYKTLRSNLKDAISILTDEVSFKSPTRPTTRYDFNLDTLYYDEDGNEVFVSKNFINFGNQNTYKGLLVSFNDLWGKYKDKIETDMWHILQDFLDIVAKADLTNDENNIVKLMLNGFSQNEIIDYFNHILNQEMYQQKLSIIMNRTIPRKLFNTYLYIIDNWIYTYRLKGKYKKCSNCGEIKLISNDRYFRKNPFSRDGYRSQCKKCEVLAEKFVK
jgi:hypothetical protein